MIEKQVVIVGGASLDTIVHLPNALAPGPQTIWATKCYPALGGTGAGKALNLAHLGFKVFMHTVVGKDQAADFVIAELKHPKIDLQVQTTKVATEQHTNLMSPSGERISVYTHAPDVPVIEDLATIEKQIETADIAAISILDYTRPTLALAKKHRIPLWIDLHDYDGCNPYHQEFIDSADVIFVASDNLSDYQQFMSQQIENGKQLVVCTHGKSGSTAMDRQGQIYHQDIVEGFELVDSNGAGDAYFSGFLFGYLQGQTIQHCMHMGSMVAAMCINSAKLYASTLNPQVLELDTGS